MKYKIKLSELRGMIREAVQQRLSESVYHKKQLEKIDDAQDWDESKFVRIQIATDSGTKTNWINISKKAYDGIKNILIQEN